MKSAQPPWSKANAVADRNGDDIRRRQFRRAFATGCALLLAVVIAVPAASAARNSDGSFSEFSLRGRKAAFSGTVTDSPGPVGDVNVSLHVSNGDDSVGRQRASTSTASNGTFSFTAKANCYVVVFTAPTGRTFTDGSESLAVPVCADRGETVSGIDAELQPVTPPTTVAPTTVPPTTVAPTTVPPTTVAPTTTPTTPPTTTAPSTTVSSTTAPSTTVPTTNPPPNGVGCLGAPALPAPSGTVVRVNNAADLQAAVSSAAAGSTVLIAPGDYQLTRTLVPRSDNVTIRGDSDDCNDVVIRGNGMDNPSYGNVPHGVWTDRSGLSVQNLSIVDVWYHSVAVDGVADDVHLYNLRMIDAGEQFVKASSGPTYGDGSRRGLVEYSIMEYPNGPSLVDHGAGVGYTQGVDVIGAHDWVVRKNLFRNFHTPDYAAYLWNPVVLAWQGSSNMVIEDNVFIDVDRAIGLGLAEQSSGTDHRGGRIANNMVYISPGLFSAERSADADAPIIVWDSPGSVVDHNTCITNGNHSSCIQFRFDTTGGVARNNLVDEPVTGRTGAEYTETGTRSIPSASIFVDPANADLHLNAGLDPAITDALRVTRVADTPVDIDGQTRPALTLAGADER